MMFLNEIRKAIIYMKLLFINSSGASLPILPLRSSVQKDLLSDLFNIYSKIILKTTEGWLSKNLIMDKLGMLVEQILQKLIVIFKAIR